MFPLHMAADRLGVSTSDVKFWLTPWRRTDEHLPLSHIAEVAHTRGFFWDAVSVESSGGANPLWITGVSKSAARYFVEHVRERLNEFDSGTAAATAPLTHDPSSLRRERSEPRRMRRRRAVALRGPLSRPR